MKNRPAKTLTALHTSLGVRSVYDSVSFCNRCGLCANVCPAYQQEPQETNSPRARNQGLRLLLEGQLKTRRAKQELNRLVTSCLLCGQCTRHCPGQIPTAQHMLELRRRLNTHLLPKSLFTFLRLRQSAPALFKMAARTGLWFHHVGFVQLVAQMTGSPWLNHLQNLLPKHVQKPFCFEKLSRPTLIYLPSLTAEFVLTDIARSVYHTLSKKHRVNVWSNTACGLFEYVYGDLQRARKLLRRLITRHQQAGSLPLVTDSIEIYAFLKQAPQLFEEFPHWQQKAQKFAKQIRFITDFLPKRPANITGVTRPVMLLGGGLEPGASSLQQEAQKILRTLFKQNLVQCEYGDIVSPYGYSLIKHTPVRAYALQTVRTVAKHQVQTVFVLSALAALELEFCLRTFYPTARASHIARLNG